MSDKWYYTHETAIHGPVSGDELHRLVQAGAILPTDMVWPAAASAMVVPARTALLFLKAAPAVTGRVAPASPPAVPDWLPDLAKALESGADRSPPTHPSPEWWLPDVRRGEERQPPLLKEAVSPKEASPEEVSPEVAPFYDESRPRRGSWHGRIPKRLVFIGLGLIVESLVILILLTCWPDKEQKQSPATHTTQRGR